MGSALKYKNNDDKYGQAETEEVISALSALYFCSKMKWDEKKGPIHLDDKTNHALYVINLLWNRVSFSLRDLTFMCIPPLQVDEYLRFRNNNGRMHAEHPARFDFYSVLELTGDADPEFLVAHLNLI